MQILIIFAAMGGLGLLAFIAIRHGRVNRSSQLPTIAPELEQSASSQLGSLPADAPQSRPGGSPYVLDREDIERRTALNQERRAPKPQMQPTKRRARQKSPYALPSRFVVVDIETTGLSPQIHEIIEIGAVKIVDLAATNHASYRVLVKPTSKIPRKIVTLTGITQTMVDTDGIELQEAIEGLLQFIEDLPLIAFNAQFDRSFLENAAAKCGRSIKNRYTCALQAARKAWPGLPSYKLTELAVLGGLDMTDEHRAVSDCVRTAQVFIAASRTLCPEDKPVLAG